MMRDYVYTLLVCGSHTRVDRDFMYFVLDLYLFERGDVMIIHGAAPCVDLTAEQWAKDRQQLYAGFPAQWRKFGRMAGPRRNGEMGALAAAQEVAAFPGGRGTRNMMSVARNLEILVTPWGWEQDK